MAEKETFSKQVNNLRRQAEKKAAKITENLETLSPEDTRLMLHDLRVHQIELEMQNEELRTSQVDLDAARTRYFDLYDLAPVGYCTLSEEGLILESNLTAATLLGVFRSAMVKQPIARFILNEDQDIYYLHRKQLFKTNEPQACEVRMVKQDGTAFWARLEATAAQDADGTPVCRIVMIDITRQRQAGAYDEMGREILLILNDPADLRDSIRRVLAALKMQTGFDAVGIRLQDGDDFPYYAQQGFSNDFLLTENTLIDRSADGGVCRDKDGNIRLECTCGLTISGKIDPANPLFTPGGSFWTNDSFPLLALPPDQDPRLHPRNQCIHQGYASVALVPIRNMDRIVGLIQLNDRRKGCFTREAVELMEGIASHIGAALMRKRAEQALRESDKALRTSLAEKEVLLKEVHHRVKNNLAAIMGLLDLQGQMISDESARAALLELSNRIRSMALVHEQLYQFDDFSRIDFQGYLETLIAHLRASYQRAGGIHVSVAAAGVKMGLDSAVPCGLFIAELVTNAIKYAFPAGRPPDAGGCEIAVSAAWDGAAYTLTVADNGVGLPAGLDWANTQTLGLLLVKMLGQHQLQGRIELDRTGGTTFRLRFAPGNRGITSDE